MSKSKILKIGHYGIGKMIFKSEFVIAMLLLPFFKNAFFDYIGNLSLVFNALILVESILFLVVYLLEKKINTYIKLIFIFLLWTYAIAPIADGHNAPSVFYLCEAIGILCMFEVGFKYNEVKTINAASTLFMVMIVINYATLIVIPNGVGANDGTPMYLFGMRTGFTLYIIPGILLNLLNDIKKDKKISICSILTIIFGVLALLRMSVTTGLLEIGIICVLFFLLHRPKIAKKFNIYIFALVFFIFDFLITIMGTSFNILGAIAQILGKDPTFSNRTYIWANAVTKMNKSPVFGYGADNMVSGGTHMLQAHNHWLNVTIEGGYVALLLFIFAIFFAMYNLYLNKSHRWYRLVAICMSAILIGSISEIQTYVSFIYLVFDLPFLLKEKNWSN